MNITLSAHPPSMSAVLELQSRTPRTAFADRIAMRIGVALLVWGTRHAQPTAPDVSGYVARTVAAPERTLARYAHPFPPIAR